MVYSRKVLARTRYGVNPVPKRTKRESPTTTAADVLAATDSTTLANSVVNILKQGGAVMLGQTRDNSKLIITVYLDGESDKEYCEDVQEAISFLASYQV